MKLNRNAQILLGLAGGITLAYAYAKMKKSKVKSATSKSGSTTASNGVTRSEKIDYILENADSTTEEDKSGFGGDRFKFNPTLGYMLPTGVVHDDKASSEMDLSKEGDLANDIFFNAYGDPTDDPTAEAEAILNELSDKELNVAYVVVKERKNKPGIAISEIAKKGGMNSGGLEVLKTVIIPRINDIKALKKTPNWKEKMEQRKRFKAENKRRWNVDAPRPNGNSKKKGFKCNKEIRTMGQSRVLKQMCGEEKRIFGNSEAYERCKCAFLKDGKYMDESLKIKRPKTKELFANMVTNRSDYGMWGGHRNDGERYPMT